MEAEQKLLRIGLWNAEEAKEAFPSQVEVD